MADNMDEEIEINVFINNLNFMAMNTKLIISGLALIAVTTITSAQNNEVQPRQNTTTARGPAFVDANNDGVCDNNGMGKAVRANRNGRGNGNCYAQGQRQGQRQGQGQGQGRGQGQNRGRNFVDADKNGICDFNETPASK